MNESDLTRQSVGAVIGVVTSVKAVAERRGAIRSYVTIEPEEVIFGELSTEPLVLREPGGRVGRRGERVFGAAQYSPGERVLVFLSQNQDGTLRTTAMSMGKYRLADGDDGTWMATRELGEGVTLLDPRTGTRRKRPRALRIPLSRLFSRMRNARPRQPTRRLRNAVPPAQTDASTTSSSFTFLGAPSRWFEPDVGASVDFFLDSTGDETWGLGASRIIVRQALIAWSEVPSSRLLLGEAGFIDPIPFAGCEGPNRIVFNDPFDEVVDPTDCRGVLAIGGFCFDDSDTRTLNDTTFLRITIGKVTFADGWNGCALWNPCNVAEVATHELGHAVGFGHSDDETATMTSVAQFDGRCASLAADDVDALTFAYPADRTAIPPTATGTPTRTATRTARPTRTMLPTATPPPTRTPRPTDPKATATKRATVPIPPGIGASGSVRYYASNQPVGSATLDVRGTRSRRTQTDAEGHYSFDLDTRGNYSFRPAKIGGAGSGISALDAALALQAAVGRRSLDALQSLACDVTGNGDISPLDALWILQLKADMGGRFPVGEACGSDWAFVPAPSSAANQTLNPPAVDATPCQTGAIDFSPLTSHAVGQDFLGVLFGDCSGNWQSDEIAMVQEEAPPGTALDLQPMRRARGGRVRLPIGVRSSDPFFSLDAQLRFDPTELEVRSVRPVPSYGPLLRYNSDTAGRLVISLANPDPLLGNGDVLIVVEFQDLNVDEAIPEVVVSFATIDERMLPRR